MPRKGDYLQYWTGPYKKYIEFANLQDKGHPCWGGNKKSLTEELTDENENLTRDLGYLDEYYADLREFLRLANIAKSNPSSMIGSARVQEALKAKEVELLDMEETLWPYFHGYKGGMYTLNSIAQRFKAYLNDREFLQPKASDSELWVYSNLLHAVNSISNKARADWEDEVKTPNAPYDLYAFNNYVKDRRVTLLALEAMPPLPPPPDNA